jgi:hypothetical protein
MIENAHGDRPGIHQLLVAHSHGGNIAMRSLAHLHEKVPPPMIVTLATPFIEVKPRLEADKWSPTSDRFFFFLLLLPTALLLYAALSLPFLPLRPPTWLNVVFLSMALPFVGFLSLLFQPDPIKAVRKARRMAEASSLEHVSGRNDIQMLVLRAIDDEAALSLAFGAIGTRIVALLSVGGSSIAKLAAGLLVLALWVLLAAHFFVGPIMSFPKIAFKIALFTIFVAPSAVVVSWALAGACRCVYGRELLFRFFRCEVNSHSVPDNLGVSCQVRTIEATSEKGLRHGIYDEPSSWLSIAGG